MDFQNHLIQEQHIVQTTKVILEKKISSRVLNEKECHQICELDVLWRKCCEASSVTSLAASEALITLVAQNVLDIKYVVCGFLDQIISSKNVLGVIHGITEIICLPTKKGTEPYPLSLTSHPYVIILKNKFETWPLLILELECVFQRKSPMVKLLKTFEAFFQYVLYNTKPDLCACRNVYSLLLEIIPQSLRQKDDVIAVEIIMKLLIKHLKLYKMNIQSIGHRVSLCQQTLRLLLRNDVMAFKYAKMLMLLFIEIADKQHSLCMPMTSSLVLLKTALLKMPSIALELGCLFWISHFMLTCSKLYVKDLLEITSSIVEFFSSRNGGEKQKLAFFVLPLLQILASSKQTNNDDSLNSSLLTNILNKVMHTLETCPSGDYPENELQSFGLRLEKCCSCEEIFTLLSSSNDPTTLLNWLESVKSTLEEGNLKELSFVSLLLSSFLVTCNDSQAIHILDVISFICKVDSTQAPYFFPLMLFMLEKSKSSEVKFHILQTIPRLTVHQMCVKYALGILLALNNNFELKAITVRLMYKLWLFQPRVYPQLYKLLQDRPLSLNAKALEELQVSKAVTIRDICRERPGQHGEDLFGLISAIIHESAGRQSTVNVVLSCLALESLTTLVEAEVLNLPTTWNALREKLETDVHPLVTTAACSMLSFLPSLNGTADYEGFKDYVLKFLWKHALAENTAVSDASFKALANFKCEDFLIKHLPIQNRVPVIQYLKATPKIAKKIRESLENNEEIDFESYPIPSYYFIELIEKKMLSTSLEICEGFEEFLKNILANEVSRIPRGVSYDNQNVPTFDNKMMSSIPELLKRKYDNCKQPNLKGFLAGSLLWTYNTRKESRSGRATRSQVVNDMKSYRQIISHLIQDIPIKSSDWLSNIEISHGWTVFMKGAFAKFVEGRKMELTLQKEREHINEEAFVSGIQTAWLWARDTLTDILKLGSIGSHVMQGNSLLALAGLVDSVASFKNKQTVQENQLSFNDSYACMETWLTSIADRMLVTLDANVQTNGPPMLWGHQGLSITSSALLARACAAFGLTHIIPSLLEADFCRLQQIVDILIRMARGKVIPGNSLVIHNHSFLGLGLIVRKLSNEDISSSLGQEGEILLTKCFETLEMAPELFLQNNIDGAIYAFALGIASCCENTASPVHLAAQQAHLKLVKLFEETFYDMQQENLKIFSLALTVSSSGIIKKSNPLVTEKVIQLLNQGMESAPESFLVAFSLGTTLCYLRSNDSEIISSIYNKWRDLWYTIAKDQSCSSLARISSIGGISALHGSAWNHVIEWNMIEKINVEDGVKLLKELIGLPGDANVSGSICCNLARLYFVYRKSKSLMSTTPSNYEYLNDESSLKYFLRLFIYLEHEERNDSELALILMLRVLTYCPDGPLPPLDWKKILTPLINKFTGSSIHVLKLALESKSAPAMTSFLSSWLNSFVVSNFTAECKVFLFSNLHQLAGVLSTYKLKDIVEIGMKYFLQEQIDLNVAEAVLVGYHGILQTIVKESSIVCLAVKDGVKRIYESFPGDLKVLIPKLADCIWHFKKEEIGDLLEPTVETDIKSALIRRELISKNVASTSEYVKPLFHLFIATGDPRVILAIMSCLSRRQMKNDVTEELVLYCLAKLETTSSDDPEISDSILSILSALSIVSTEDDVLNITLSLHEDGRLFCQSCEKWFALLQSLFPFSFVSMLSKPFWKGKIEKITKILLTRRDVLKGKESSRLLHDCLLRFHIFEVCEKQSIWNDIVS
ncbi:focadhesin-like isoform X2 [Xenia sp. Carnegie-2017]|uniref:focadhesin-like isoform X2 n=1 Tax=Xenia sp. Carnegie-2017 TaxID=2897299 RepID=UPI001F04E24E|nr:focadhesin-like isoform X2 [Xenia sp. Carnegie-2017]